MEYNCKETLASEGFPAIDRRVRSLSSFLIHLPEGLCQPNGSFSLFLNAEVRESAATHVLQRLEH